MVEIRIGNIVVEYLGIAVVLVHYVIKNQFQPHSTLSPFQLRTRSQESQLTK